MDPADMIPQFMGVTGVEDPVQAQFYLEASGYNLETAINSYLEGNLGASSGGFPPPKAAGGAPSTIARAPRSPSPPTPPLPGNAGMLNAQGAGEDFDPSFADEEMARAMSMSEMPADMIDSAMYDEEGVRAPILPKSEILVEEDPYQRIAQARLHKHKSENANVFDMFRDYRHETKFARAGDDPNSKKIKTLADLFRPPVDLIEPGSFEHVKNVANQRNKWLLVNIQEVSEFDCQKMNRDTWADSAVKSVVKTSFILFQVLKPSEEGMRYCRYYQVDLVPHLAIIDSRTGESLDVREGFMEPKDLVIWLEKFLETNSLDDAKPSARPPQESPHKKKLGDLSEEAQLAAAVAASLGRDAAAMDTTPVAPTTTQTTTTTPNITSTTTSTSTTTTLPPATVTPTPIATPTVTPAQPAPPKEEPKPVVAEPPANLKADHATQTAECTCVIQIRLPTEQIKGFFRPTDTLRTVHQYVTLHLEPRREFVLVTTFPKKTYSGDLLDVTLKQADLVPRAVLICELV